jgi:hypothetical protein
LTISGSVLQRSHVIADSLLSSTANVCDTDRVKHSHVVSIALACCSASACYSGVAASHDVNAAWRGHSRQELEATWGAPKLTEAGPTGPRLHWADEHYNIEQLPSARAALAITSTSIDVSAAAQTGVMSLSVTSASADIDAQARIVQIRGLSTRWGAPAGLNLRWGTVFGLAVGMGRLAETPSPLPSGSMYIGGMLGPRHALIGTMNLASGSADAGGAMGFAWGLGMQWWPAARLAVRGAPALVLAFEPGFNNAALSPGLQGGIGYAAVRAGSFVLDVRFDLTVSTNTALGSFGVGVNLN